MSNKKYIALLALPVLLLTGCTSNMKSANSGQAKKDMTYTKYTKAQQIAVKPDEISDWLNKPGKRKVIYYKTDLGTAASAASTANMKSGYVNRTYDYKSPSILDGYFFKPSVKKTADITFKTVSQDGTVWVTKKAGSFNSTIEVSKTLVDKEAKAQNEVSEINAKIIKSKKTTSTKLMKEQETAQKNYQKTHDDLMQYLLTALGYSAKVTGYKHMQIK